jgi:hypothetical protein
VELFGIHNQLPGVFIAKNPAKIGLQSLAGAKYNQDLKLSVIFITREQRILGAFITGESFWMLGSRFKFLQGQSFT